MISRLLLAAAVIGATACAPPEMAPGVVATYRGGVVTQQDLDAAILALPPDQRRVPEEDAAGWYAERIRELVLDRTALEEARLEGLDQDPTLEHQNLETTRSIVVGAYLQDRLGPVAAPTEEELRALFANDAELRDRVERRQVFHLFLRRLPGSSSTELRTRASRLREDLLRGVSFETVARQHSESESRHQDGALGWIERGSLAPAVEEIVFALEPGVPSEPVMAREGVHLFLVRDVIEAKQFNYEEVRSLLERNELERRRSEALERLAGALPPIPDLYRADAEELSFLLEQGDATTPVMRAGDFLVSLGELVQRIRQGRQPGDMEDAAAAGETILASFEAREKYYRHAVAEGFLDHPDVSASLAAARERKLLALHRNQRLRQRLDREHETLLSFYETNRPRFAAPLEFELRRLQVAVEDIGQANEVMGRLEASRAALAEGTVSLEELGTALGGTIQELGWRSLVNLRAGNPRLAALLPDLEQGDYTPPYSTAVGVALLEIQARREPEPPPFEQVRSQVLEDYLERHGQEVYQAWVDERLEVLDLQVAEVSTLDLAEGD